MAKGPVFWMHTKQLFTFQRVYKIEFLADHLLNARRYGGVAVMWGSTPTDPAQCSEAGYVSSKVEVFG